MIRVTLTDAERAELAEHLGSHRTSIDVRARLWMVALSDRGHSPPRIAQEVGRHENTVRRLLKRFQAERLEALPKRGTPGRVPHVREEHWLALEAMLDGPARAFTCAQMAAWLRERFGLTVHPRYLAQRLKKRGWRYQRTNSSLAHREPDAGVVGGRRQDLEALEKADPGAAAI